MRRPRPWPLRGRRPYVIHLSEGHPPLGALGYVDAAVEILDQAGDFDSFVVASGSGSTHAGLLAGLRGAGSSARVIGSCVRREAAAQGPRIRRVMDRLARLCLAAGMVSDTDIELWDGALAPGYGRLGPPSLGAIERMAHSEGLHLDPVYTAKSFAAIPACWRSRRVATSRRAAGSALSTPAVLQRSFAYQQVLTA